MMRDRPGALPFVLAFALTACGGAAPPPTKPPTTTTTTEPTTPTAPASKAVPSTESIGVATMLADGTIQLQLIARGEGGMIGEALLGYPPSHARYRYILDHLGGLQVGESKPVPPFPD